MKSTNVKHYNNWYTTIRESVELDSKKFGLEGSGKHGVIMAQDAQWKEGKFVGAQKYWSSRGETQASRGTYDYHVYYSPSEFRDWELDPAFAEYDTRGMRRYWDELSTKGMPVTILVPGTGEIIHHRDPMFIAYQDVYLDLVSIPEFTEIMKAKEAGTLGKLPNEVIMSLKAKSKELDINTRSQDIFDKADPRTADLTKSMVRRSWRAGLI